MHQPKNYVLYARKSTEGKTKQIQSIDGQIQIMQRRAEAEGMNIVSIIQEEKSAKIPGIRPGFRRMIRLIEDGEVDGILCWHTNRLARNPKEMGEVEQLLYEDKLKAIVTAERTHRSDDNALLLSVESGMSTQYSRDLAVSVKRGMQQKVERGWIPHQPTIGYINNRTYRTIENDPERFALVKMAWEMLLTGNYSVSHIARVAANDWGLNTVPARHRGGNPVSESYMHSVFKKKFYAGIITYNNKEYPGAHEAMITVREFERAQAIISRKTTYRTYRERKEDYFIYRGLLNCGECGCAITFARKTRKSGGKTLNYDYCYCTKRRKQMNCQQRPLKQPVLTSLVQAEISDYEIAEPFFQWACQYIDSANESEDKKQLTAIVAMEDNLQDRRSYLKSLQQRFVRGQIEDDFYQVELRETKENIEKTERNLKEAEEKRDGWRTQAKEILTLCRYANEEFAGDTTERRRLILNKIGRNIQLADNRLLLTPRPGLVPIKNANKSENPLKDTVGTASQQRKNAPLRDVPSQWYTRQDLNL